MKKSVTIALILLSSRLFSQQIAIPKDGIKTITTKSLVINELTIKEFLPQISPKQPNVR